MRHSATALVPRQLKAHNGRFAVNALADTTTIDLYDVIGSWGVSAKQFRDALNTIATPRINLRINSPGGDVFDGLAMYEDLRAHPSQVHVTVTALAASAASVVAMAGDEIAMADSAYMMVHNAWTFALGDAREMRRVANLLTKINGTLADIYAARTDTDRAEIAALMDAETWLDATEAVERGFADDTAADDDTASATYDLSVFARAPKLLEKRLSARAPASSDYSEAIAALTRTCAILQ